MEPTRDCNGNPINYTDPSGHDAIWLQQTNGANNQGHTAVAIQIGKSKQWAYYSFASATPGNIVGHLTVGTKMKITRKRITLNTTKREHCRELIRKVKSSASDHITYNGTVYIEGDFSNGLSYMRSKKKQEKQLKYYLTEGNCKTYVVNALEKGKNVRESLYFNSSLQKAKKELIPNTAYKHMKNYENFKPVWKSA